MEKGYWKDVNVLVTGATGFLGSWLVKSLADEGANVVALVRRPDPEGSARKSNLFLNGADKKITKVYGELEDYALLGETLKKYRIHTVFHAGAQLKTPAHDLVPLFEANIRGTWNVLEACRHSDSVKKIISVSSDKSYGPHHAPPYDETFPLQGSRPYDVSKSAADLLSFSYSDTYKLPVSVARYGNLFGGGDLSFDRLIPSVLLAIHEQRPPVLRSDGSHVRDFLYIEDAVRAFLLLAMKMDDPGVHGQAFNFSYERPVKIIDLVSALLRLMKSDIRLDILNSAKGELVNQFSSAQKARKVLGWVPAYDLDSGLAKTVAWYENYFRKNSGL